MFNTLFFTVSIWITKTIIFSTCNSTTKFVIVFSQFWFGSLKKGLWQVHSNNSSWSSRNKDHNKFLKNHFSLKIHSPFISFLSGKNNHFTTIFSINHFHYPLNDFLRFLFMPLLKRKSSFICIYRNIILLGHNARWVPFH